MNLVQILLFIFGALPNLIHAAEEIGKGFPGQGQVKKQAVLDGLRALLMGLVGVFPGVDVNAILAAAGTLIDLYVAAANAAGLFQHGGRPAERIP